MVAQARLSPPSNLLVKLKCHMMFPQMIRTTDFSPSRRDLLEEMALQAEVLDRISCLLLEKNDLSPRDSQS